MPDTRVPDGSDITKAKLEFTADGDNGLPEFFFRIKQNSRNICSLSPTELSDYDVLSAMFNSMPTLITHQYTTDHSYSREFTRDTQDGANFLQAIKDHLSLNWFGLTLSDWEYYTWGNWHVPTNSVKLTIWYTPPQQTVVQQYSDATAFGTPDHYEAPSFASYPLGYTFHLPTGTTQYFRADTNLRSYQDRVEKYHDWGDNDYRNHHPFTIPLSVVQYTAKLKPAVDASFQTYLIDGGTGGTVEFSDPWVRDDNSDGIAVRNRGTSPNWHPLGASSSPLISNPWYKGVFLDEGGEDPVISPPYYSVRASLVLPQLNGCDWVFQGWEYDPNKIEFRQDGQNPPEGYDQKPLVFKQGGASLTARYKAHFRSNSLVATGSSSQRKIGYYYDRYHLVYESAGDIWYTTAIDGTTWIPEVMVSRGAGKAHNPSIAERGWEDDVLYISWVDTTVRQGATGYDICVRRLNLSESQWDPIEPIVDPEFPSGTGFARADAKPVAVAYSEYNIWPHVVVAYEGAGSGIRYSLKSYNEEYSASVWKTAIVPSTGPNSGRPSMTLGHDAGWNNDYLVLTYDSSYAIRIATSTNFEQSPSCSFVLFNAPQTVPAASGFLVHSFSSVDVDHSGRQHVTWHSHDEGLAGTDVALHRSRDLSGNWSVLNEFVSELVDGPNVTTSISARLDGGGGTVLFSDRSNLLNYASSDGIHWEFLGYTYYPTGVKYPSLSPKAFLFEEASVITKNSSPLTEVAFELRDNSGGLQKTLAVHDQLPDPSLIKHYQRIDLADTTGDAWLSLALGNAALVDQNGSVIRKIDFACSADRSRGGLGLRSASFTLPSGISFKGDVRAIGKAPRTGAEISLNLINNKTGATIATLLREEAAADSRIQLANTINSTVVGIDQSQELAVVATLGGIDAAKFVVDSVQMTVVKAPPSGLQKQQISGEGETTPIVYALHSNYPNPFNPATTLRYDLPMAGNVSLVVYDLLGRQVSELVRGYVVAGSHSVTWNALSLASGMYIARFMVVDDLGQSKINQVTKLILMK
jgi:hypothetical protein